MHGAWWIGLGKRAPMCWGWTGVLSGLTKRVWETVLEEEPTERLGCGEHDPAGTNSGHFS